MRLWWRTKPAADEHIDITDSTRKHAIAEALYQATADADAKILRISGKHRPTGKRLTAPVERVRTDRCT